MRVLVSATAAELAATVAARIIDSLQAHAALVLGLPTGRTPLPLYEELARRSAGRAVDWSSARTFNLDEWVGLNGRHASSYRAYMQRCLFEHVNLDAEHIEFLDGAAPDLDEECRRYEQAIAQAGGIDLLLLGLGRNGHIGFNEPAAQLQTRTHRTRLTDETRASNAWLFGGEVDRVPTDALSIGMATIIESRAILVMVSGSRKAQAASEMVNGPLTTAFPASLLQLHPNVTALLDREAARLLQGPAHAL